MELKKGTFVIRNHWSTDFKDEIYETLTDSFKRLTSKGEREYVVIGSITTTDFLLVDTSSIKIVKPKEINWV